MNHKYRPATVTTASDLDTEAKRNAVVFAAGQRSVVDDVQAAINAKSEKR